MRKFQDTFSINFGKNLRKQEFGNFIKSKGPETFKTELRFFLHFKNNLRKYVLENLEKISKANALKILKWVMLKKFETEFSLNFGNNSRENEDSEIPRKF